MLAVAGTNTFACDFEEHTGCLMSDDVTANDTWHIVDGRGLVADNTMNNGQ